MSVEKESAYLPPVVQFDANKDFQTSTHQKSLDSSFLGYQPGSYPKPQPNPQNKQRIERELLKFLLVQNSTTDCPLDAGERMVQKEVTYQDLDMLTDEDLQLIGFKRADQREQLLTMFKRLPNQLPSYEDVCKTDPAQGYNNVILGKAASHLMSLRSSLAATNYKLNVTPAEDVIVGDKQYASRFALETLQNLKQVTDEIAKDLRQIEENAKKQFQVDTQDSKKKSKFGLASLVYFASLAVGCSFAWFWWWTKFHSAPRLERISIQT
ncbi:hypothetical protein KR018_005856 [Drosophila ironensis]|nr:hypothetical protein KR018_005856 [Drosophila ironensis]